MGVQNPKSNVVRAEVIHQFSVTWPRNRLTGHWPWRLETMWFWRTENLIPKLLKTGW